MSPKTHNRRSMLGTKVELRQRVLEHVKPARVLDCFCGEGAMRDAVWKAAAHYTGIDQNFTWPPRFRRFVGDNRRILRALDLSAFNVFDLDAFGSPWHVALIIAHRRRWAPGELGAIVFTDGSGMNTRFGAMSHDIVALIGAKCGVPSAKAHEHLHPMLIRAWARRAGVKLARILSSSSSSSPAGGSQAMYYSAALFSGRSDS